MGNEGNRLDEMQRDRRNQIGNQMFLLTYYGLLLDVGLYAAGIRWLRYPANIVAIITAGMVIYLVRTILANAYLPPEAKGNRQGRLIGVLVFSVLVGIVAAKMLLGSSPSPAPESAGDPSAMILFAISGVGLLVVLVSALVRRAQDGKAGEE